MDCEYCGGDIAIRNPTGNCDHLYYPHMANKNFQWCGISSRGVGNGVRMYTRDHLDVGNSIILNNWSNYMKAPVAELADALDLGSSF